MSRATMSILGLYRWNEELFSELTVPEGVDKDILVNEILRQCRELEICYSDPEFMQWAIGNWSSINRLKWEKLYKTTTATYDPIENYNRYEEIKDSYTPELETVSSVSAYNTSDFRDASKVESKGSSTNLRESHIHGNIGVTTSQQMLESERKLQNWSIYQFIVDSFKLDFCLLVY